MGGFVIVPSAPFGPWVQLLDGLADEDMVLVCVNGPGGHEPVSICSKQQLYQRKLLDLMIGRGATEVTIMPYRNAGKVTIKRAEIDPT